MVSPPEVAAALSSAIFSGESFPVCVFLSSGGPPSLCIVTDTDYDLCTFLISPKKAELQTIKAGATNSNKGFETQVTNQFLKASIKYTGVSHTLSFLPF